MPFPACFKAGLNLCRRESDIKDGDVTQGALVRLFGPRGVRISNLKDSPLGWRFLHTPGARLLRIQLAIHVNPVEITLAGRRLHRAYYVMPASVLDGGFGLHSAPVIIMAEHDL